ncbi:MAG: rRNA maturation RNase YbeY [Balneolaceae bacterium]|nr:rRNA maturation RNase YbeY [Balneolaceae bacterium]
MSADQEHIQLFNESGKELSLGLDLVQHIAALVETHENCSFSLLEVVFVDEKEIKKLNREHLGRNYVTDVITFPYEKNKQDLEGTVFICLPRVYEQALEYNEEENRELRRVLIHGLMHLVGYRDGDEDARKKMTERENFYLEALDQSGDG